jgi:hypothetical protein
MIIQRCVEMTALKSRLSDAETGSARALDDPQTDHFSDINMPKMDGQTFSAS